MSAHLMSPLLEASVLNKTIFKMTLKTGVSRRNSIVKNHPLSLTGFTKLLNIDEIPAKLTNCIWSP